MNNIQFTKNEILELSWEKPSLAQIELTRNCNQSCVFCFQDCSSNKKNVDLGLEEWKKIINKLKHLGVTNINFSGGENCLHKDFEDIIIWSKKQGFNIVINTNGTFSLKNIINYVDEIVFSIHGLFDIHNKIVGLNNSFELIENHIMEINDIFNNISINMVVVKSNFKTIEDVYNYFENKYKIKSFSATLPIPCYSGSEYKEEQLDITYNLLKEYFLVLKKIPEEKLVLKHGLGNIFKNTSKFYDNSKQFILPSCIGGKYKLVISYDGSVYPCNFFRTDSFYCGNILYDDPVKIWNNGNGFKYFRNYMLDEMIHQDCKQCFKKNRCFGGCRAWTNTYISDYNENKGIIEYERDMRCEITNAFIRTRDND